MKRRIHLMNISKFIYTISYSKLFVNNFFILFILISHNKQTNKTNTYKYMNQINTIFFYIKSQLVNTSDQTPSTASGVISLNESLDVAPTSSAV